MLIVIKIYGFCNNNISKKYLKTGLSLKNKEIKCMKNNKLTNLIILDSKTGEFKSYLTEKELRALDNLRGDKVFNGKLNNKNNKKDKNEFKRFVDKELGSFYFTFYNKLKEQEHIFRFLYLCSYMNYKNYLEFGGCSEEGKLATKKDIIEMLEPLSTRRANDTIKYLIENKLITITRENYVLINKKISSRGKTNNLTNGSVRMVDKSIKELYKSCNVREHTTIDLLIKLLPHVSSKFNIICENPLEEDINKIKPLKQIQILEILGVNKSVPTQLVKFKIHNGKESVFCKVSNAFVKNAFVINPRFCFSSQNKPDLEKELEYFKLGSKNKRG